MTNNEIIPGFDNDREESLKIVLQKVPDVKNCLIIVLNGYIDTYNANFLQKQIQKVIDAGFTCLIFHCGSLNHISSTGIGSFSAFLKAVKPKGGDLILTSVQPNVQEVFQLLGFSQFFNMKGNLEAAINTFKHETPEHKAEIFPILLTCPICSRKLKAVKSGRFRCSVCKTILAIDDAGKISLG